MPSIPLILHILLVAFLVIVFPLWDRRETRRLKTSADPRVRVKSYQKTIAWQIVATAVLLATIPARQLFAPPMTAREMGIDLAPWLVIPILIGMLSGLVIPVLAARTRKGASAPAPKNPLESIAFFLPRGPVERAWFAAMSVTVGVCEEIIFRGFLIRFFAGPPVGAGVAIAVALATVIFAIDHGYQGVKGMIATGLVALLMTLVFFVGGSLWPAIVIHVLLDLRVLLLVPRGGLAQPDPAEQTASSS